MRSMRAMIARLAFVMFAFAVLGVGACGETEEKATESPTETVQSATSPPEAEPTYPPPPTPLPESAKTPPNEEALKQFIFNCVGQIEGAEAAALELNKCSPVYPTIVRAHFAEGSMSIVLVDFMAAIESHCFFTVSYLAWRNDAGWHAQSAEPLLQSATPWGEDAGTRFLSGGGGMTAAQQSRVRYRSVIAEGQARLGVIHSGAECGSGAPSEGYLILELRDGLWSLLWNSGQDARTRLGHRIIEFTTEGLDSLRITGDSWVRQDAEREVFHESNSGPHRYFDQTWTRMGETYDMTNETVLPTSYNTLVGFAYSLSVGDRAGAQRRVIDPALVDVAISYDLQQNPLTERWYGYCGELYTKGSPCTILRGADEAVGVQLEMIQVGTEWVISAIDPCTVTRNEVGATVCI